MRRKGSAGGHNGLSHIEKTIGNSSYPRLRFGVGSDFERGRQAEYVLSIFSNKDCLSLEERIEATINMIQSFTTKGIERTMSDLNGK